MTLDSTIESGLGVPLYILVAMLVKNQLSCCLCYACMGSIGYLPIVLCFVFADLFLLTWSS
jgi:hypothetical protein